MADPMEYKKSRVSWGVIWKMKPSEYDAEPEVRVYNRNLGSVEEARVNLNECRRNPRCAAAAIVRIAETWDAEEVFPSWDAFE